MKLKNLETSNLEIEINNLIKDTREKTTKLHKEIWKEKKEKIKLKDYKINNYGDHFSIDIDDSHWLTIKIVEGEIVFDAKHEWFIDENYFKLEDDEIIDNWNIDMINRYLKNCDHKLITKEKDIEILNNLFNNLSKQLLKE